MYEIEKGIEAPTHRGPKLKYPWLQMEKGDSFFVPLPEGVAIRTLAIRVRASANRSLGKGMCKAHVVTENGVEGVRAWRVK